MQSIAQGHNSSYLQSRVFKQEFNEKLRGLGWEARLEIRLHVVLNSVRGGADHVLSRSQLLKQELRTDHPNIIGKTAPPPVDRTQLQ